MTIVAVAGMPGSGKGEAIDLFIRRDFAVVALGDAVRDETRRRGLELSGANLSETADSLRVTEGDEIWARRTLEKVKEKDLDRLVIDGVRSLSELEFFEEYLRSKICIIAIHASPAVRYERMRQRRREDDRDDDKALLARDSRELDYGLGKVIALANHMIVNESSLSVLRERLETLFSDKTAFLE